MNQKVILVALLILAILLRAQLLPQKTLHQDEFFSEKMSNINPAELLSGKISDRGWPPFYYILLHFWRTLQGSEEWMRILSLLFGFFSLLAIWHYSKKFFGEKTATVALLLASFSWFHIYYSLEIRAYSIIVFLSTISFFSFYEAVEKNSKKQWVIFAAASIFGLLASFFQLFIYFILVAYLLAFNRKATNFLLLAVVCVGSIITFFPWLVNPAVGLFAVPGNNSEPRPAYFSVPAMLAGFSSGHPSFPFAIVSVPITIVAILLFLQNIKTEKEKFVAFSFLFPVILFFFLTALTNFLSTRYLFFVYPIFVIIVSKGIRQIREKKQILLLLLLVLTNIAQLLFGKY